MQLWIIIFLMCLSVTLFLGVIFFSGKFLFYKIKFIQLKGEHEILQWNYKILKQESGTLADRLDHAIKEKWDRQDLGVLGADLVSNPWEE